MSADPKVSVIVPNYNHGHFLAELIEGLDQQNPKPFEVIVIDDKSSDDSVSIISDLQKQFPYIRLINHQENQGAIATLNHGIDEAKGDYLVFRAADDLDLPGHFETALTLLEKNPDVDLFCGDLAFFTKTLDDGIVEPIGFSDAPTAFPQKHYPYLLGTRWVNGHTVMIRTEAMHRSGPFSADVAFVADWFHFMVAGFRGGFCYAPQVVVAARVSPHSYSSRQNLDDEPTQKAIGAMLDAIIDSYRDTLEAFVESDALLRFGTSLSQTIRLNAKFECFNSVADKIEMIQLGRANRELSFGLEHAIRQSLESRLDKFLQFQSKNPSNSFWVYGAGGHTRALLAQWKELRLPQIKGIIVTGTSKQNEAYGFPIHSLSDAPLKTNDAVVLSSKSYEGVMANQITDIRGVKTIAIWNQNLDTFN